MAKISRNQLKSLVKECLIEVLAEGLSSEGPDALVEAVSHTPPKRRSQSAPASPAVDSTRFDDVIGNVVNSITDDPMMSSIFGDTARTTLQEQLDSDRNAHAQQISAHGDPAAKVVSNADPSELFEGASANWATLAFSDGKQQ